MEKSTSMEKSTAMEQIDGDGKSTAMENRRRWKISLAALFKHSVSITSLYPTLTPSAIPSASMASSTTPSLENCSKKQLIVSFALHKYGVFSVLADSTSRRTDSALGIWHLWPFLCTIATNVLYLSSKFLAELSTPLTSASRTNSTKRVSNTPELSFSFVAPSLASTACWWSNSSLLSSSDGRARLFDV